MTFTKIDPATLLGIIAGICTTLAFLPQVLRTWRLRSARDISLTMISLSSAGIFLWFIYGLYINSMPVIVANFITFILASTILVLKIRFG